MVMADSFLQSYSLSTCLAGHSFLSLRKNSALLNTRQSSQYTPHWHTDLYTESLLSETLHVYSWGDAYWKWTLYYGMEFILWLIWSSDKREVFIHEISPHVCFLTVIALLLIVSIMAWPYFGPAAMQVFFVINGYSVFVCFSCVSALQKPVVYSHAG